MKQKLYVASSWRNLSYDLVCEKLQKSGFDILDWRKQGKGFTWDQVGITNNDEVNSAEYRQIIYTNRIAAAGFDSDFNMMKQADQAVMLLPCEKSAHFEAGWFWGAGTPIHILGFAENMQPELMYLGADTINFTIAELVGSLRTLQGRIL